MEPKVYGSTMARKCSALVAEEIAHDLRLEELAKRCTNCYCCSKAKKTPVISVGQELSYEDCNIKNVHDFRYDCPEKLEDESVRGRCFHGDQIGKDRRCQNCVHGKVGIEASVKTENASIITKQILYTCSHPKHKHHKGEFFKSYYSCDDFEKKVE